MNEVNREPKVLLADKIDKFISQLSHGISWVYALLIIVIIAQVVLRKGFSSGLIVLEELQWHLYAVGVMFGMAYAQVTNAHVRVDLLHSKFKQSTKHVIEIIGIAFLLLPFLGIIFFHSLDFVEDSWRTNEHSAAPAGLPYRWIIKSMIPISVALLALAALSRMYRSISLLFSGR